MNQAESRAPTSFSFAAPKPAPGSRRQSLIAELLDYGFYRLVLGAQLYRIQVIAPPVQGLAGGGRIGDRADLGLEVRRIQAGGELAVEAGQIEPADLRRH